MNKKLIGFKKTAKDKNIYAEAKLLIPRYIGKTFIYNPNIAVKLDGITSGWFPVIGYKRFIEKYKPSKWSKLKYYSYEGTFAEEEYFLKHPDIYQAIYE